MKVEIMSSFVGLELKHCQLPFPNHGHVILADPSPILFYSISSYEIRCLVDIPGPKLPSLANGDMAEYLKTVIAPQVPPDLHDAFISAVNKGKVRTMRNRSMPAVPCPKPGALLIGDAFNMRHALTGGGMMMALSDIVVLRNLLRNLTDLKDTHLLCKHLESFYTLRKVLPMAFTLNTMAGVSYKISCAPEDQGRKEMHEAIFDYLSIGGVFSEGPVSLLCGLNPHPLKLLFQFSAVGIYSVGRLLIPFPSPKRLWSLFRLTSGVLCIIFPIIKAEGVKELFIPSNIPAYYRVPSVTQKEN
ncbi:Squalene monooxygenase SE2 [Orobanche hederae]